MVKGFEKSPVQADFSPLLIKGAGKLDLSLTAAQVSAFKKYLRELRVWGKRLNLISRGDDREIVLKDFLDSLTVLKYLNQGASLLDLGSGAGFPGLPLKIVRPDLRIVLLEANRKKVYFLKNIIRLLGLEGITVYWPGGEGKRDKGSLGVFDFVISRAFGPLLKFSAEGLSFLKPGGFLIAMKGKKGGAELQNDLPALEKMGLKQAFLDRFLLPFLGHERILIGLRKE